jgi:hypothetical protein
MRLCSQPLFTAVLQLQADEAVNYGGMVELLVTKSLMVLMIQDLVTMQMVT